MRLGIGHPGDKAMVHHYVLGDFAKAEKPRVEALRDAVAAHIEIMARGDDGLYQTRIAEAMHAIHGSQ